MNCFNCKHWLAKKDQLLNSRGDYSSAGETAGECRGSTPKFVHGKGGPFRVFPVTIASDWCGAWAQGAVVVEKQPTETASTGKPAEVVIKSAVEEVKAQSDQEARELGARAAESMEEVFQPKRRGRPPKNTV